MIYKYLSIGAVVLFLTLGLYLKGRSDGADKVQAKFDAYKNTAQLAYDRQVAETARIQSEWNRSKERETEWKLKAKVAGDDAAAVARRLRLRSGSCPVSGPTQNAGNPSSPSGESPDLGSLEESHFRACASDSSRLEALQEWYNSLRDAR